LIGVDLDKEAIIRDLDECLLTEEEMKEDWKNLTDSFGWVVEKA
jgi:hypothetical protein